jgi:branched-subunit amino acid ABC-type transport system permease component
MVMLVLASKVLNMPRIVNLHFAIGTAHSVLSGILGSDAGDSLHLYQHGTQRLLAFAIQIVPGLGSVVVFG